jgi:hypothetical protein
MSLRIAKEFYKKDNFFVELDLIKKNGGSIIKKKTLVRTHLGKIYILQILFYVLSQKIKDKGT